MEENDSGRRFQQQRQELTELGKEKRKEVLEG